MTATSNRSLSIAAAALALVLAGCDANPSSGEPSDLAVPAAVGSGQPHLAVTPDDQAVLSWLEPDGDGYALRFSRLVDGAWSTPGVVARGDDFFVNWADFPAVEPITADVWIAHWLKLTPDAFGAYDIAISLSADGGRTWSEASLLNNDGTMGQHGFVTLFPMQDDIGAVWLDGRRLAEELELFQREGELDPEAPLVGMALRHARIAFDGSISERGELDMLVCDCCQTDAAVTETGPVIVYRDRSESEIRDNAIVRQVQGRWQEAVTLGPDDWQIEGCPVNGPAVAARGEEVVAAWFTAPGNQPKVKLVRSTDGGVHFGSVVEIDGQGAFGHVDVVLIDDGAAVVSWWRRGADGIALAMRRVERNGELGEVQTVAENRTAQPLDVPQMVEAGGNLVFAWTDATDMTVRSAFLPVD